ncbi:hypothetical protein OQA88_2845 [Cercophora sp. LCS_1]
MWDRLKPAPLKTAGSRADDGIYSTPLARGYSYSIKGGPPPSRPPREFLDLNYEAAPPVQPPPRNPNRIALRASNFGPASSFYSQHAPPSPDGPVKLASTRGQRPGVGEISPPSSPEHGYGGARRHRAGDVSPIDDDADARRYDFSSYRNPNPRPGRTTPLGDRPPSQNQNRGGSNIPMMRRARRKQSDAALREAHAKDRSPAAQQPQGPPQEGPRWDPLTGERTASPRGRPSQVKPAEFAQGLGITSQASSPPQQRGVAPSTLGDRVKRMARKAGVGASDDSDPAAGAFTSSRPGWRGASGRSVIVDPVHDNPEVAPLRVPERNNRRVVSPTSASAPKPGFVGAFLRRGQTPPVSPGPETGSESAARDTIRKVVPSSQLSPTEASSNPQDRQNYPQSPVSPNIPAPDRAARELTRDVLTSISANAPPSPAVGSPQDKLSAIRRKPPASSTHQPHDSVSSSVYSQQPEQPPAPPTHNPNPTTIAPSDPWVQPPSRFSVTTYATSAADGTPRESLDDFAHNHPPVPSMPSQFQESPQPKQESVMDRRRPKLDTFGDSSSPTIVDSPVHISLKDYRQGRESQAARDRRAAAGAGVHNSMPAVARARTATTERPTSSASSINKMLPPVPPETSAGEARDRVGLLNAQLQALGNRRININRSIKQMTELMPTDNVLDSFEVIRKREEEKRKVEMLKLELAEVQREEYELGLKLHRAYKRQDRDAEYEVTGLWVRRVTG